MYKRNNPDQRSNIKNEYKRDTRVPDQRSRDVRVRSVLTLLAPRGLSDLVLKRFSSLSFLELAWAKRDFGLALETHSFCQFFEFIF